MKNPIGRRIWIILMARLAADLDVMVKFGPVFVSAGV